MQKNIRDYTLEDLEIELENMGEKKYRAKQIYAWLFKGVNSFDEMTDLSKDLISKLKENFLLLDVDENRSKGISVRTELIKKYKILDPDHGEVDDLLKVVTGKIE